LEVEAMPLVEVKVFNDELTPDQKRALIQKITDAITAVTSEKLKEVTWVIVSEVPSGNWGVGGSALGLDDIKKLIAKS
jgi:4-oxalocrotonate tautomerase